MMPTALRSAASTSGLKTICEKFGALLHGAYDRGVRMFDLADMYGTGQLMLDEMITRRYRLDDINDAFDDLLRGDLIRGVIDFGIA